MHYQEKLDKIFADGNVWKHRTLRTVFDPYSTEYEQTTLQEKVDILKKIKANNIEFQVIINQYKKFYIDENKRYVAEEVEGALIILLSNSLSK